MSERSDHEPDLVTTEGVDEGSAASAVESTTGSGAGPAGAQGEPAHGGPADGSDPAPPDGTTSTDGRGQTLEVGEG